MDYKLTTEQCQKWLNDKSVNPVTGKTIISGSPLQKMLEHLCEEKITIQYSKYIDTLFNKYTTDIKYVDEETLSFVTPYKLADKVTNWILDEYYNYKKQIIYHIIDATSSIGGNSLSFIRSYNFKRVTSIEINIERYKALKHNINLYIADDIKLELLTTSKINPKKTTIDIYNKDFISWFDNNKKNLKKNTVVFVDPPWGGSTYKEHKQIKDLYLDGNDNISMFELADMLDNEDITLVLKLPYNYSLNTLSSHYELYIYAHKKTLFVMVGKKIAFK